MRPTRRWIHVLGPLLGVGLFATATVVLHHILQDYRYRDLMEELRLIPQWRVALAMGLTAVNYLILTGYDVLSLRYIRRPLPYRKTALASFAGYAFAHNLGFAFFSGAAVRLRLYTVWGLSAFDVARVAVFNSLTFWLGWAAIGGSAFLVSPSDALAILRVPPVLFRGLGLLMVLAVPAYLLLCRLRREPLRIRNWEVELPSLRLGLIQLILSMADWALAGLILWALLPGAPGYWHVLFCFLFAVLGSAASQVPGGLGVFESVVLLLLSPLMPAPRILGGLLIFRGVYYLLPLGTAALVLGMHELMLRRKGLLKALNLAGRWFPVVIPQVISATTFLGGVILLVSGAIPRSHWRMEWLKDFLPLPVVEVSHFLGSLAGVGLLLLARGLQKRIDSAYVLTIVLLYAGMLFSLLKGLDYEEAVILGLMLLALMPCRKQFYRKGALLYQTFTPGWIAAIVLVLASTLWLGHFAYKHVEYAQDLWWHFSFRGDAPRFLRATVGAVSLAFVFAVIQLMRPARMRPRGIEAPPPEELKALLRTYPDSYANLALLGDKQFLFNEARTGFVMYGISGRSWVAMGDPVGAYREQVDLAWEFKELCDRHGVWPVFYQVDQSRLPIYLDLGLALMKLGEEARVRLEGFTLAGNDRKGFRNTLNRFEKEGWMFQILPSNTVEERQPELGGISDAWLAAKNTREKRFSLGRFDGRYLSHFPLAVVRRETRIVAFANLWTGGVREELSIDLMRYHPDAPGGVMDFLFMHLILWGQEQGYRWFNLGMAPFSGLRGGAQASLWSKVGSYMYRHGEDFYNFQGLRRYKEKFGPVWISKYLACPGGLALPGVAANVTALISGSLKGAIGK